MLRFKTYAICFYLVFIYWISLHIPHMNGLFFPTLGAFSLLFISRPFSKIEVSRIAIGAVAASAVGSLLAYIHSGALSLLATLLVVISLIHIFKWNAPPILAVALIPYFTQPTVFWVVPLSVCGALAGLLLTLTAADYCEQTFGRVRLLLNRSAKAETDTPA